MDELKTQMRWVCFDKGKTPINPYTGLFASSTDPKTWATYAQAKLAAVKFKAAGVGFIFNGDGIVGIDLDKCLERISVDENGEALYDRKEFAKYIMSHAESYAEVSPSKTGIHIIGTAKIAKSIKIKLHDIGVEVYDRARYFTYTEDYVGGEELPVADIQAMVNAIEETIKERDTGVSDTINLVTLPDIQPTADAWTAAVLRRATETAVKLMEDATAGTRHNMRLKAGKLLGGYIAGAESINAPFISDTDAVLTKERHHETPYPRRSNRDAHHDSPAVRLVRRVRSADRTQDRRHARGANLRSGADPPHHRCNLGDCRTAGRHP